MKEWDTSYTPFPNSSHHFQGLTHGALDVISNSASIDNANNILSRVQIMEEVDGEQHQHQNESSIPPPETPDGQQVSILKVIRSPGKPRNALTDKKPLVVADDERTTSSEKDGIDATSV